MLIELGAVILNKVLTKLLDELFPINSVASVQEVEWEVDFSKKGINIKYKNKRIELDNKQITDLINDKQLNKDFLSLRQDIRMVSQDKEGSSYLVRSQGNKHSMEIAEKSPISGSIKFKEKLNFDEIYKKAFLRRETITVDRITFLTADLHLETRPLSLRKMLDKSENLSLKATQTQDAVKCKAIFESATSNYKFYDFKVELGLYDYTEDLLTFKNHLESNPLVNMMLVLPMESTNEDVQFTYSLSSEGCKDVDALIMFNTINRLVINQDLKLTIKRLDNDDMVFSGTIPKVNDYLEKMKKELESEIAVLNIIKTAQNIFGVKFKVPEEFTKDDEDTLNILEILISERVERGKARGPIIMKIKPYSSNGVITPIEGKITLTHDIQISLFGIKLEGVTRILTFHHVRETGLYTSNRKRFNDGSIEIKLNQYGDRIIEMTFLQTKLVEEHLSNEEN